MMKHEKTPLAGRLSLTSLHTVIMQEAESNVQPLFAPVKRANRIKNLTGNRFGTLNVELLLGVSRNGKIQYQCRCDCGIVKPINGSDLKKLKTCGCGRTAGVRAAIVTHGMSRTQEYRAWAEMKKRCLNEKSKFFFNYGGRGIGVCERWMEFEAFFMDMGVIPSRLHSLDRIKTNGNYEPGNCRWATRKEQNRNQRRNHRITVGEETMCIADWADRLGVDGRVIVNRILKGWNEQRAVLTPKTRIFK